MRKLNTYEFVNKGALKKRVAKEKDQRASNSLGRSTLKVRWKDMIEISNVIVSIDDDHRQKPSYISRESKSTPVSVTSTTNGTNRHKKTSKTRVEEGKSKLSEAYKDGMSDEDVDENVNNVEIDDDLIDGDDSTTTTTSSDEDDDDGDAESINDELTSSSEEEKRQQQQQKQQKLSVDKMPNSEKKYQITGHSAAGNGSCNNLSKTTSEHLLLEPLHATGLEFEKEMNDRIEKLNRIKVTHEYFE